MLAAQDAMNRHPRPHTREKHTLYHIGTGPGGLCADTGAKRYRACRGTRDGCPDIPSPVQRVPVLEPPRSAAPLETYSVVVTEVPVKDMLFALARDAKLNVDVHPGVTGTVTLNAIDQTLPQILDRISRQADVRFTRDGDTLEVQPDSPFLRTYQIDYVNMSRNNVAEVSVATQIATTGTVGGEDGGSGGNNNSTTRCIERLESSLLGNSD